MLDECYVRSIYIAISFIFVLLAPLSQGAGDVWRSSSAANDGWYWLPGFEFVYVEGDTGWAWDPEIGWMWSSSDSIESIFFYVSGEWFWTSDVYWPACIFLSNGRWVTYYSDNEMSAFLEVHYEYVSINPYAFFDYHDDDVFYYIYGDVDTNPYFDYRAASDLGYKHGAHDGERRGEDQGYDHGYEDGYEDGLSNYWYNSPWPEQYLSDEVFHGSIKRGRPDDEPFAVSIWYWQSYNIGWTKGYNEGYSTYLDIGYDDGYYDGNREWSDNRNTDNDLIGIGDGSFTAIDVDPDINFGGGG